MNGMSNSTDIAVESPIAESAIRSLLKPAGIIAALAATVIAILFGIQHPQPTQNVGPATYWVWKWSDLERIDPAAPVLLYQGNYLAPGEAAFEKRGGGPFSVEMRSEVGILVRAYEIDDPEYFVTQLAYLVDQWRSYQVQVTEIQIDYDSPSRGLTEYQRFIDRVKVLMEREGLHATISITGLLTWIRDDLPALERLAESADYIVFQLYDVFDPIDGLESYRPSLEQFAWPYKIGITTSNKFEDLEIPGNENYRGVLVFLNVSR